MVNGTVDLPMRANGSGNEGQSIGTGDGVVVTCRRRAPSARSSDEVRRDGPMDRTGFVAGARAGGTIDHDPRFPPMSWLLFLDESGHDHRQTPYEVRGGFAIHASKLWPFIQAVRTLEQSHFGSYLHEHGSEIKG